ncbi:MAG: hypothetical protein LBD14_03445 [Puniceicoccales bacterium]|nr:hypothetical protein [Puniceicoccales bacterium]
MTSRHLLATLLLSLASITTAHAQSGARREPEPVSIRVSFLSLDAAISGLTYGATAGNGKKGSTLDIPSDYKPLPIHYNGPSPLVLYRNSGEKNAPVPVSEITPPKNSGTYLVLLKRVSTPTERYASFIVAEENIKNPGNTWCLINLSKHNVTASFGDINALIPSGKSAHLDLGTKPRYINGVLYLPTGKPGYSTRFRFDPGRARTYLFFDDPNDPAHLLLKGIPNVPAPSPPSSTTGKR